MKVRTRYLELNRVVADAETLSWDLRQNSPITAIEIRIHADKLGGAGDAVSLLGDIDNLRVVDGSKNYCSAGQAKYIHGMGYGLGHKLPVTVMELTAADESQATLMMYFGRYFGDREYYLDPRMMNNPQLQFTSALTIAGNNYATGTLRASIIIHSLEGSDLNHRGVLITKEVIAAVVGVTAEVRIDMPVDQPWWSLGIYNESAATLPLHPFATILNYELDVNNGEKRPFEYQAVDLMNDNIRDLGLFHVAEIELVAWPIVQGMGVSVTNTTVEANMCCPYGAVFIPFHHIYRQQPLEFNVNDQARLIMTGGATGGVGRILLSQLASTGYFS